MTEYEGIRALGETVQVLAGRGIDYWLGRGLFRHFSLTGEFGDQQSDIDFHVHRRDEKRLAEVVKDLSGLGFSVTWYEVGQHKLSLGRGSTAVEFMFLDGDPDDELMLFHRTAFPPATYYCAKDAFGGRTIDMFGITIRVPDDAYLPATFGSQWRDNKKGSGGTKGG